jgi:hypothetical protein
VKLVKSLIRVALLLTSGEVLVTGGAGASVLATAEIYQSRRRITIRGLRARHENISVAPNCHMHFVPAHFLRRRWPCYRPSSAESYTQHCRWISEQQRTGRTELHSERCWSKLHSRMNRTANNLSLLTISNNWIDGRLVTPSAGES